MRTHQPRRRRAVLWSVGAGLVATVTAVGLVMGGEDDVPEAKPSGRSGPSSDQLDRRDGVPVGYTRTGAGAKAAAANYVTVHGSAAFLADRSARHDAVRAMSADRTTGRNVERADRVAEDAGRPKLARTGVLSETVKHLDARRAVVELWTVAVRGDEVPEADFATVTVDLVWEDGDWKVASLAERTGPRPPVDYRQSTSPAADFDDFVDGEAASPVLSGSGGDVRSAAVNAVVLQSSARFMTDETWRHRVLRETTAPDRLDAITREADATAQLVATNRGVGADGRTADGAALVMRTAVLAARTEADDGRRASVELWTASVGGVADPREVQVPQVAFRRMHVDLTRTGGTWKTTSITPGEDLVPRAPAAVQASPAEEFAHMGGEPDAPALP